MNKNTTNDIKLSPDVITSITEIAIQELDGVHSPSFFSTKKIFKSHTIEVIQQDNDIELTVPLVINYGVVIPDISPIIQEKIKENIEIMTGLNVKKIHLSIVGVNSNNISSL